MSTGPEHYRKAERLLEVAQEDVNIGSAEERYSDAAAQVHATLALVAVIANTKATAEHPLVPRPDHYGADNDALTWTDVIQ